jgi:hypothetical protein
MRQEISEPQHWRSRTGANPSWSSRRRATTKPLPAELVDAAFGDESTIAVSRLDAAESESPAEVATQGAGDAAALPELLAGLNDQLVQLEAHRRQIEKLLADTNGCQGHLQ